MDPIMIGLKPLRVTYDNICQNRDDKKIIDALLILVLTFAESLSFKYIEQIVCNSLMSRGEYGAPIPEEIQHIVYG